MNHFALADAFSWLLSGSAHWVVTAFRSFAEVAAPVAVAALWQGAAVAAALAICLRLAPRISAAHRFAAWAAGFAVLIGLEFLPLFAHSTPVSVPGAGAAFAGSSPHPWLELSAGWSLGIAALWTALAALRAADLLLHSIRLRRLWKSAMPVEDRCGAALGMPQRRRGVQVYTTHDLDRPSVIGFFAPRILIPDWLYARLTPGELDQVVLHEAEHLRRRDDWTNLLQKLCLVVFPLNPALVWIERRLCREREMACDEGVVRVTGAPRSYAACLAGLAERRLQRRTEALSLGAFERRPELVHRVHSILLRKSILNPLGARALLGVVGCGLVFGAVELARCPQMVAFAPAQSFAPIPATQATQADWVQPVPAAYLPSREPAFGRTMAGFRATRVEAILPANPHRQAMLHAVRQQTAKGPKAEPVLETKPSAFASAEPRRQLLKAEMPSSGTSPAQEAQRQPQEWVVFTAWQVQTSTQSAGEMADYDASAKANGAANETENETGSQPSAPASRITVTRLILKIYPANPGAGSAPVQQAPVSRPDSNSKSVTKSILSRPAVLPFDSGWLVIQL